MSTSRRQKVIDAAKTAVDHLIKVAKEEITNGEGEDLSAEKLKNAAATKKLAIFDALEILDRINQEEAAIKQELDDIGKDRSGKGFAERRAS